MSGSNRPQTETDRKCNTVAGREATMGSAEHTPRQPASTEAPRSETFTSLNPTSGGGQKRYEGTK